jgi:hypothetical protein
MFRLNIVELPVNLSESRGTEQDGGGEFLPEIGLLIHKVVER